MTRGLGLTPLLRPLRQPQLSPRTCPLYRQFPRSPFFGAARWQSTVPPEEEGSIPKDKDRGHIDKSEAESLVFFDSQYIHSLDQIFVIDTKKG